MEGGIRAGEKKKNGEMCWRVESRGESSLCSLRNALPGCTFSHLDGKLGHMVRRHIATSNRKRVRGEVQEPTLSIISPGVLFLYGPEIN